jgi:Fic family protein
MAEGAAATEGYQLFPPVDGWAAEFDASVVDEYAEALDDTRRRATTEALDRAVRVATRYAAVDTGAIEGLYTTTRGFTRTIAEQTSTWQAALAQHGEHVRASIEDALNGYDLVLDLVTGRRPVTESWIRQLHEVLCASQTTYRVHTAVGVRDQPLPKGAYKTQPNSPTNPETGRTFHYAPPADTPAEMARLVKEMRTPTFGSAHPVVQASYVHYALVRVHPFADGNGRVARALASVFLYRSPGVPLVVFADQRDQYLDALEAADAGRPAAFVAFIGERTIDTIDLVRLSLESADEPDTAAAVERLRAALDGSSESLDRELARAERRIRARVLQAIRDGLDQSGLPDKVAWKEDEDEGAGVMIPDGLTALTGPTRLTLTTAGSFGARLDLQIWRSERAGREPAVRAVGHRDSRPLELRTRDVVPTISSMADLKIAKWCDLQISLLVDEAARYTAARTLDDPPSSP